MSPLENRLQEQKNLINKGYSVEEIQCAALMQIATRLESIDVNIEHVKEDIQEAVHVHGTD